MILPKYENNTIEYKSLKIAIGKQANLKNLAKTCVSLANTQGGYLIIGIEDRDKLPPSAQKINYEDMNKVIKILKSLTDSVGLVNPELRTHENGGQYFILQIYPSQKTIATTSDGKVFIRIGDACTAIKAEDLTRIAHEKGAFQWELVISKTHISTINLKQSIQFVYEIRNSEKISNFIKEQTDEDILEYLRLTDHGYLTNLGILWLGDFKLRSKLNYPITIQYIVYNENEEKVRKLDWSFNHLNPKELLLEIQKEAIELNYSFELPNGLFRKQVRHYDKEVVRELLVNAFVHKSYTISGDIIISVFKDRLEIRNPGGLPLGVTKNNILHQVQRRNPKLIDTFKALALMENEGSGYDLIYEKLSLDGKLFPIIETNINYVNVTIYSNIIDSEILQVLDFLGQHYQLTQKEIIVLGIIVREKKILGYDLSKILQLPNDNRLHRLRSWINKLIDKNILITEGRTKGLMYRINPKILSSMEHDLKPSLKTMEEHKLKALIIEDLSMHYKSKISEIHTRLEDLDLNYLRRIIYKMYKQKEITREGVKSNMVYFLPNKKRN